MHEGEGQSVLTGGKLIKGLIVAVLSGVLCACYGIAVSFGGAVSEISVSQYGNPGWRAAFVVAALILWGGSVSACGYCVYKFCVNRSWTSLVQPGIGRVISIALIMAVLHDAAGKYDAVWCLGDLVGYGPNPNECVALVRQLPGLRCLVGNHDRAALGEIDIDAFNLDARIAIRWTQDALNAETVDYLENLPEQELHGDFTLVHGSPRQPVWEYILDRFIAAQNFAFFETPYCLVGHTNTPIIYKEADGGSTASPPDYKTPLQLTGERYILNPGSVGQPRDGSSQAAYAILDLEGPLWAPQRVAYDVEATQLRMQAYNLPERLIVRLGKGW